MRQQLEATTQLIGLIMGQAWVKTSKAKKPPMTQQERAELWLKTHPGMDGLNQRDAAKSAGVGLATMQRAINSTMQKQLF